MLNYFARLTLRIKLFMVTKNHNDIFSLEPEALVVGFM